MSEKQINSIDDLVLIRNQSSCNIEYHLYKEKAKIKAGTPFEGKFSTHSGACFSQLRNNEKDNNRINYKPIIKNNISQEKAIQWINLCVEEGLLPGHADGETVLSKGIVLDLKQPRSMVYAQLCLVRYIAEEVSVIDAILFLAKEKVSVFAGLILAGKTMCNNPGHNFISNTGYYPCGPKISAIKIPLNSVIGLRRFWRKPAEYDKEQSYFVAAEIINNGSKNVVGSDISLDWSGFRNPHIVKAIKSKTDDSANKAIKKYKEQNEKSIIDK